MKRFKNIISLVFLLLMSSAYAEDSRVFFIKPSNGDVVDKTFEVVSKWNKSDVMNAYLDAPKKGLDTMIDSKSILEWGKILLNLSKEGLEKRNIKNKTGKDESIFLKSIMNTLLNKKTKASKTIEDFNEKKGIDFFYE